MGAESLFDVMDDTRCIDCRAPVTFLGVPSEATCVTCELRMYVSKDGIGRYPSTGSFAGGIQGRKPGASAERGWHPAAGPQDPPKPDQQVGRA